eukprot:jgi/Botrbrau1/6417/Bobra.49_1s0033.1
MSDTLTLRRQVRHIWHISHIWHMTRTRVASDFNAALYEHTQRVRRARDAEDLRQRYEAAAGEGDQPPGSLQDYSLRPGETITLSLPKKQGPGKSTGGLLSRLASSSGTGEGKKCGEAEGATPLLLAPPPRAEGCTPALLAPPPQTEGGTPHLLAPHPRASAAADKTQNPNPVSAATGSHLPIGTAIGGRGSEGGAAPLLPPPPPPGVDASQPAAGMGPSPSPMPPAQVVSALPSRCCREFQV